MVWQIMAWRRRKSLRLRFWRTSSFLLSAPLSFLQLAQSLLLLPACEAKQFFKQPSRTNSQQASSSTLLLLDFNREDVCWAEHVGAEDQPLAVGRKGHVRLKAVIMLG